MWMSLSWMRMNFNLQHRNYELGSRNAGPLFTNNDQTVRPAQVSTKVDYGVYLQFWVRRGASEVHCAPPCRRTLPLRALTRRI